MFEELKELFLSHNEVIKEGKPGFTIKDVKELERQITEIVQSDIAQAAYFYALCEELYGSSSYSVTGSQRVYARLEAGEDPASVIDELISKIPNPVLGKDGGEEVLKLNVMENLQHCLDKIRGDYFERVSPHHSTSLPKKGRAPWVSSNVQKRAERVGHAPIGMRPVDLTGWNPQPVTPKVSSTQITESRKKNRIRKAIPTQKISPQKPKAVKVNHSFRKFSLFDLVQDMGISFRDERARINRFWISGSREELMEFRAICKQNGVEFIRKVGDNRVPAGMELWYTKYRG